MLQKTCYRVSIEAFLCGSFYFLLAFSHARAVTLEWVRQLGTAAQDGSQGISADGLGNVYISGWTNGSLGGPNAGDYDVVIAKYNATGGAQWMRQIGTSQEDTSYGVSADHLGNVYICGWTYGSLGSPNPAFADAILTKYDAAGNYQWTQQLGNSSDVVANAVSADGLGNVYISGWTSGSLGPYAGGRDAFLAKYDAAGNLQWTRQLGTSGEDESTAVSSDGLGNIYISGYTDRNLGGPNAGGHDAFVAKYDAAGNLQWTRQLGTADWDSSSGVFADGIGNIYISGWTDGSLGGTTAGGRDVFVAKYDSFGNIDWKKQFGSSVDDSSTGISGDGIGNVYISGATHGDLGGTNAGGADAFVANIDPNGNLMWTRQFGSNADDQGQAISADGLGGVYSSGQTLGSLDGPNAGGIDAFVAKFSNVPEPSTLLLAGLALVPLIWQSRHLR